MNEVFIPRDNTELAADLQDVEIKVINGRAEKGRQKRVYYAVI